MKRLALWEVLKKSRVPPQMLKIITSFHEGMQAEVRFGGALSECFRVRNGLCHGCTLAPTLFNLFLVLWCLPGGVIVLKCECAVLPWKIVSW